MNNTTPKHTEVTMDIEYKCKDNDVELKIIMQDDIIDEIWVRVIGEKGWTVVGYFDLLSAINKAFVYSSETYEK